MLIVTWFLRVFIVQEYGFYIFIAAVFTALFHFGENGLLCGYGGFNFLVLQCWWQYFRFVLP